MTADLLLVDGRFLGDGDRPIESVAITGGRIVAAGSVSDVAEFRSARTEVVDLGGAFVTPGLTDAHAHVLNYGRSRMGVPCWPGDVSSVGDIVAAVRAADSAHPPGTWLRGRGYDPARLTEGRAPTADELDLPSGRPVVLDSFDFHRRAANHAAIEAAGIGPGESAPPGGEIVRDEHGRPTGEFLDSARGLLDRALPPWTAEQDRQAIEIASEHWLGMGFTAVTNAAPLTMSRWGEEVEAFLRAAQDGQLPIRVRTMIRPEILPAAHEVGLLPGVGDDLFRIIGVKAFTDGAIGPRTASLLEPYTSGGTGRRALSDEDLADLVSTASEAGWRLCIHAIGDEAVLAAARALAGGSVRGNRIEHCQLTTPEAVAAMVSAGTVPVPQMAFLRQRSKAFVAACGEERTASMYPLRTWIDAGLRPVHSSDAPVVPDARPMPALETAVTRRDEDGDVWGPGEAVTVAEGLAMMTRWAAAADGEDRVRGSIAAGHLADLTVLEEDPRLVPGDEIAGIPPLMTVVAGRVRTIDR